MKWINLSKNSNQIILTLSLLIIILGSSSFSIVQDKPIDKWIKSVVEDMIEMNDLSIYSDKEIPSNVTVNFFFVELVKDIKIEDDIISMLISSNGKEYCNELKFRYVQKKGQYYLVFSPIHNKVVFGKEKVFINPWIEAKKKCE